MHNKILINAGFYLMLLFSFSVTVYPVAAYFLALGIFLIWLLDVIIFRDPGISAQPLFFPILGFNVFIIVAWFLHWVYGAEFQLAYVGLLSMFYFIVPGFVITGEQRRMILWTFIAGAMLMGVFHLIMWWATFSSPTIMFSPLATPLSFAVILAFCVVTAFYAESLRLKDKLFYFLVSIPLFLVIIFSDDKSAMMILILALLAVGVFVERTIFIPVALALVIFFSGILDVRYLVERNVSFSEYAEFAKSPAEELSENKDIVIETSFFGSSLYEPAFNDVGSENNDSFFMTLIRQGRTSCALPFSLGPFRKCPGIVFQDGDG